MRANPTPACGRAARFVGGVRHPPPRLEASRDSNRASAASSTGARNNDHSNRAQSHPEERRASARSVTAQTDEGKQGAKRTTGLLTAPLTDSSGAVAAPDCWTGHTPCPLRYLSASRRALPLVERVALLKSETHLSVDLLGKADRSCVSQSGQFYFRPCENSPSVQWQPGC